MAEVFHERLKSPIPTRELERRSLIMVEAMKSMDLDCILAPNSSQYLAGTNRWLTDTTAEVSYPQSSFIDRNGDIGYIACSGPPLDLYPPTHLIRIGKPWNTAPYFSVFKHTWDWEGQLFGDWIEQHQPQKIGIAGLDMMAWNYLDYLIKHYPEVEFQDVSELIAPLRAGKSTDELAFVQNSIRVLDKVMGYMQAYVLPGTYEYEVRSRCMKIITDLGGEEMLITLGSAPAGEKFALYPSFFQNRLLQQGDEMYLKIQCSGPGGFYTTLGRMFSIGQVPSAQLLERWEEVVRAEGYLREQLVKETRPEKIFASYNDYLVKQAYEKSEGFFAYGQGYDYFESPLIQKGETLAVSAGMSLGLSIELCGERSTTYGADSYVTGTAGLERLSQTPFTVLSS